MEDLTRVFVRRQPPIAILALEDDANDRNGIERGLDGSPVERLRFVKNLRELREVVVREDFNVVSIDWDIGGSWLGDKALKLLRKLDQDVATIIYSVNATHHRVRSRAAKFGADSVLAKTQEEDYFDQVKRGARITLDRRIAKQLVKRGFEYLPDLREGLEFPEELEGELCERTRELVIQREFEEPGSSSMLDLVKKRGWWRTFETGKYARSGAGDKLGYLCKCAELDRNYIARIVRSTEEEVSSWADEESWASASGGSACAALDALLSILFYHLQLVGFEPDLLQAAVRARDMFEGASESPPWDEDGLKDFLEKGELSAVKECLEWVRRR